MKEDHPIDVVVMWVDGNDPAWQAEFSQYYRNDNGIDASFSRFREWDNLQYVFRSIEKFAPWVRKVHLITWGHTPKWLNLNAPKLHFVKHSDFVPKEYLPNFSGFHATLNWHRIDGLAEHFIAFDDDMFIGKPIARTRFFRNGLPVDMAQLTPIPPLVPFAHYTLNCIVANKKRHDTKHAILQNFCKWFDLRYGIGAVLKNVYLFPVSSLMSFKNPHVATPFLKSTFEKLWQEEFDILDKTCRSRFRNNGDVHEWLMRYEQIVTGQFIPHGIKDTRVDTISDSNVDEIARYIVEQKYKLFCINDSNGITDFEKAKTVINNALNKILPEKSLYEL
jgi:hypothetical protein